MRRPRNLFRGRFFLSAVYPLPMLTRPRHYAVAIIALPTADQRRAAVELVPLMWREWVRDYVIDYFRKRRCLKAYQARRQQPRSHYANR